MRRLLDVNVLIALLDQDHSLHEQARAWFVRSAGDGWSSCPLTQNGCVRTMSHASYPNAVPVARAMSLIRRATSDAQHEFWPDDVSLADERIADVTRIHGPRQLTDAYLVALAVRHGGTLATFDRAIAFDAVHGAARKHLTVL